MKKTNLYGLLAAIILSLFVGSCTSDINELEPLEQELQSSGSFIIQRNIDPQLDNNPSLKNALTHSVSDNKGEISTSQKAVTIANEYIIHTEVSNYMEVGEYHSYTFPMTNLIDTSLVQNLMLSYKGDEEEYESYLVTYNDLTPKEKEQMALGNNVDVSGRVEVSLFEDQAWQTRSSSSNRSCVNVINFEELLCHNSSGDVVVSDGNDLGGNCATSTWVSPVTIITVSPNCNVGGGGGSSGGSSSGESSGGSTGGGGGNSGTNPNPNNTNTAPPEEPEPCNNQSIDLGNGECITGITLPIMLECLICDDTQDPDPCDDIEEQLQNESYQNSITALSMNFGLEHETGFEATRSDGNYENVTPPRGHNSVDVRVSNPDVFGYTHVHQNPFTLTSGRPQNPPPIFSSKDVETFLFLIQNADANNIPASELFAGVLSSTNHFQLRFTGDPSDIDQVPVTALGDDGVNLYRKAIDNSDSPEEGLLKYINELNIEGIELYELLDDGSTVKLSLNEDGTALLPPTPCN